MRQMGWGASGSRYRTGVGALRFPCQGWCACTVWPGSCGVVCAALWAVSCRRRPRASAPHGHGQPALDFYLSIGVTFLVSTVERAFGPRGQRRYCVFVFGNDG
jgi:hypothetical protein